MRLSLRHFGVCALAAAALACGNDPIPPGEADASAEPGRDAAQTPAPDSGQDPAGPDAGRPPPADASSPLPGPDAGREPAPLGAPCEVNGDCASGVCNATVPGGFCTAWGCSDASPCAAGGACHERLGQTACFAACTGPAGCRAGFQCFEGACLPACTASAECGTGARCEDGTCVRDFTKSCQSDTDCPNHLCLLPERVCTTRCFQRDECASGASCAWRPVLEPGSGAWIQLRGMCVPPGAGLATGSPCSVNSACQSGFCHLGTCSEACRAACPGDLACVRSQEILKDGYVRSVDVCLPPQGPTVWNPDIRPPTDPVGVAIPENTVSFTIVLQGEPDDYPTPTELLAPDGTTLFTIAGDFFDQPERFLPQQAIGIMGVPDTPLWPVMIGQGPYWFTPRLCDSQLICTERPQVIRIYYKLAPGGAVDSGALSLNFFFSGTSASTCGPKVSAASAPSAPVIAGILDKFATIYANAGISLGTVSYYDLNRPDLVVINGSNETQLGELFSSSQGRTGRAVNVFFVNRFTEMGLLGIAGGIPGPPLHGTSRSGVVVSWESTCYPGYINAGNVVAHEVGHYLGLFHNIEQSGGFQDNIPDTTTSHNNLMYWNEEGGEEVSPGQGMILRSAFLVE